MNTLARSNPRRYRAGEKDDVEEKRTPEGDAEARTKRESYFFLLLVAVTMTEGGREKSHNKSVERK